MACAIARGLAGVPQTSKKTQCLGFCRRCFVCEIDANSWCSLSTLEAGVCLFVLLLGWGGGAELVKLGGCHGDQFHQRILLVSFVSVHVAVVNLELLTRFCHGCCIHGHQ